MPTVRFRASLSAAAAVVGAGVSAWVAAGVALAWDREAVDLLYLRFGPAATDAMRAFSRLGDPMTLAGVCAATFGWLAWRRRLGDALFFAFSVGGAGLLGLLKPAFDRPRPEVPDIAADYAGSAYPSGHALLVAAVAAALAFLPEEPGRRAAVAAVGAAVALADGLARVYLGAHFPLDVVGGWALALAWVAALAALGRRGRRP